MAIEFDLGHDFDLEFSRSNITLTFDHMPYLELTVSQEWEGWLTLNINYCFWSGSAVTILGNAIVSVRKLDRKCCQYITYYRYKIFSFKKIQYRMLSGKLWPFCSGLSALISLQKMSGGQRPRILLTAPSNAAVDELMKRLVKDRQQSG